MRPDRSRHVARRLHATCPMIAREGANFKMDTTRIVPQPFSITVTNLRTSGINSQKLLCVGDCIVDGQYLLRSVRLVRARNGAAYAQSPSVRDETGQFETPFQPLDNRLAAALNSALYIAYEEATGHPAFATSFGKGN